MPGIWKESGVRIEVATAQRRRWHVCFRRCMRRAEETGLGSAVEAVRPQLAGPHTRPPRAFSQVVARECDRVSPCSHSASSYSRGMQRFRQEMSVESTSWHAPRSMSSRRCTAAEYKWLARVKKTWALRRVTPLSREERPREETREKVAWQCGSTALT